MYPKHFVCLYGDYSLLNFFLLKLFFELNRQVKVAYLFEVYHKRLRDFQSTQVMAVDPAFVFLQ